MLLKIIIFKGVVVFLSHLLIFICKKFFKMANNVRFIKAKKAFGNFSLPVDMVYVLDSDIDNEQ